MSKPRQLPAAVEQPTPEVRKPQRIVKRATGIERPPDKRIVVVHTFQWHLIIKALAFLILALALAL